MDDTHPPRPHSRPRSETMLSDGLNNIIEEDPDFAEIQRLIGEYVRAAEAEVAEEKSNKEEGLVHQVLPVGPESIYYEIAKVAYSWSEGKERIWDKDMRVEPKRGPPDGGVQAFPIPPSDIISDMRHALATGIRAYAFTVNCSKIHRAFKGYQVRSIEDGKRMPIFNLMYPWPSRRWSLYPVSVYPVRGPSASSPATVVVDMYCKGVWVRGFELWTYNGEFFVSGADKRDDYVSSMGMLFLAKMMSQVTVDMDTGVYLSLHLTVAVLISLEYLCKRHRVEDLFPNGVRRALAGTLDCLPNFQLWDATYYYCMDRGQVDYGVWRWLRVWGFQAGSCVPGSFLSRDNKGKVRAQIQPYHRVKKGHFAEFFATRKEDVHGCWAVRNGVFGFYRYPTPIKCSLLPHTQIICKDATNSVAEARAYFTGIRDAEEEEEPDNI